MTKQLIALAIAATFGIAHAADTSAGGCRPEGCRNSPLPRQSSRPAPKVAEAAKAEVKAPGSQTGRLPPRSRRRRSRRAGREAGQEGQESQAGRRFRCCCGSTGRRAAKVAAPAAK